MLKHTQKEKISFTEFWESLDPQQLDQAITNLYLFIISREGSCISFSDFDINKQFGINPGTLESPIRPCDFCPLDAASTLTHTSVCSDYNTKLSFINEWIQNKKFNLL